MHFQSLLAVLIVVRMSYQSPLVTTIDTLQLSTNSNRTNPQTLTAGPWAQSNLTEEEVWPLKDPYWLLLDPTSVYLALDNINTVLRAAVRKLEKREASTKITGILSFGADRSVEPYNEAQFAFQAIPGQEVTFGDALMVAEGLLQWYNERRQFVATYFYVKEQGPGGRGDIGFGAMKRSWQPFPPRTSGNSAASM